MTKSTFSSFKDLARAYGREVHKKVVVGKKTQNLIEKLIKEFDQPETNLSSLTRVQLQELLSLQERHKNLRELLVKAYDIPQTVLKKLDYPTTSELYEELRNLRATHGAKATLQVTAYRVNEFNASIVRRQVQQSANTDHRGVAAQTQPPPGTATVVRRQTQPPPGPDHQGGVANQTQSPPSIGEYESYEWITLVEHSELNTQMQSEYENVSLIEDLTTSYRTQLSAEAPDGIEMVVGIDMGTSSTKVIIQDPAQETSWAIPFTNHAHNPYLLPSQVYLKDTRYKLEGASLNKLSELKLPLIFQEYTEENLEHLTAFITLVIRQSREWFIKNIAPSHDNYKFTWYYHMGLPAENYENKNMVFTFQKILLAAIKLSKTKMKEISQESIKRERVQIKPENYEEDKDYKRSKVVPEIQAQLMGYANSDKYDPQKNKFMVVDVGGGTVDVCIANLVKVQGQTNFNNLQARVEAHGIQRLHNTRLDYVKRSAAESQQNLSQFRESVIEAMNTNNKENLTIYPDSIKDYVSPAVWPVDFCIDTLWYSQFSDLVNGVIHRVRQHMDVAVTQWLYGRLQFILCGGGSLHSVYSKIKTNPRFEVIELEKPDKLQAADLSSEDYHRLSVAYGLSFPDPGDFIRTRDITPMPPPERVDFTDRFISRDDM